MKSSLKFLVTLFFVLNGVLGWGQVTLPHHDPINYTVGQGLQTQTGWASLNSGDALLISSGNLTYTGLGASSGNKVTFDGTGIDAAKLFTQQTTGTVYYSFLLNITSLGSLNTTGGYFTSFTEGAGTIFGGTVWLRSDGAGYDIGINPRTTDTNTVWSSGTQTINTTLFVVISYQIISGTSNDVVNLWINPTPGSSMPAATLSATNSGTDLANINRILLRQEGTTTTPFVEMDELRVGTTWADVTPAGATINLLASPSSLSGFNYIETAGPSVSQNFVLSGTNLNGTDVTLSAPTNYEISEDNSSFSNSITLTAYNGNNKTLYVRLKSGLTVGSYNSENITISGGGDTEGASVSCSGNVSPLTISFNVSTASITENGVSYTIQVNTNAMGSHTADIVVTGGTATNGNQYAYAITTATFTSSTSFSTDITFNNNNVCAGATDVTFGFTNLSTGLSLGTNSSLDLTINDDDFISGPFKTLSFESGDDWGYTGNGSLENEFQKYNDSNSYQLNNSEIIETDNINIAGYTNVFLKVAYAATDVDSDDDLILNISYDGGSNYSESIKLIDGLSNYDLSINNIGNTDRNPVQQNPYIFNVPSDKTQIRVKFTSGTSGASDFFYVDDIILTGDICNICSEPTTQATFHANSPQSITGTSVTLNWTNGNGTNRIVLLKEANAITFVPVDGSSYSANANFSAGTALGDGSKVVYNGSAATANITGLTPGTIYYAEIFEYACAAGNENYLTSGTPTTDIFVTTPENPNTFDRGCINNTSIILNWTPPATGTFQGYLLTVRQGTTPSPVNSIDPSSIINANTNLALAEAYGTSSYYLYNGIGTNATITGLTQGLSYTFKLYAYTDAGTVFEYSSGTTTTPVIALTNVTTAYAIGGDMQATVLWNNPSLGCYDKILVVANETSGIDFTPTGDGSTYLSNTVYGGINSIIYNSTSSNVTVTGLTNGTAYYFEIFVNSGSEWSSGVEVLVTPNTGTKFNPGELFFSGYDGQYEGTGLNDEYVIATLVEIVPGTQFSFVNSRYEAGAPANVRTDKWGGSGDVASSYPGVVNITYIGATNLPAGSVLVFNTDATNPNFDGSTGVFDQIYTITTDSNTHLSVNKRTDFSISLPFGSSTAPNISISDPDQIFLVQGAFTSDGTIDDNAANYILNGTLLHGLTNQAAWVPLTSANSGGSASANRTSRLPAALECFNLENLSSNAIVGYYENDKIHSGSFRDILSGVNDSANWTFLSGNDGYYLEPESIDDLSAGKTFNVTGGNPPGTWVSNSNTNWFYCANWENLRVPDENTDVYINVGTATAIIDSNADYSNLYSDIAQVKNLIIASGKIVDMATGSDAELHIYGNWENNAGDNGYLQGGTVHFIGINNQTVQSTQAPEEFYNIVLDNPTGFTTDNFNSDLHAEGDLTLSQGNLLVKTGHYALAANNLNVASGSQITVADKGSLIQTGTGTVTGGDASAFKIIKTTGSYYNYDYIYWSSPVENLNIENVFSTTNGFNNYKYKFAPDKFKDIKKGIRTGTEQPDASAADGFDDDGDDWATYSSGVMDKGLGYIVMGQGSPSSFSSTNINTTHSGYTVNFTGQKVNNGSIDVTLYEDKYNLDGGTVPNAHNINLNLVGNPYPSAISTGELYKDNASIIEPNFYFWTHAQPISNAFTGPWGYNFSNNSFASATVDTGTYAVTTNALNTGLSGLDFTYIASGQAFFVQAQDDISSGTTQLNFNNSMRGATHTNTSFLRMQNTNEESLNRIWLSLTETNGDKNPIVLGFSTSNADGLSANDVYRIDSGNDTEFYSLIPEVLGDFDIQFLSEFSDDKTIPLGMEIRAAGSYAIQIEQTEGVFVAGQKIYLEDTYLDIIHEMGMGPYTFTQTVGENINDRFILRFTNSALGNEETVFNQVKVYPNPSTGVFNIAYYGSETLQYTIYDLTGKTVLTGSGNQINLSQQAIGLYVAKITDGTAVRTLKLVRE